MAANPNSTDSSSALQRATWLIGPYWDFLLFIITPLSVVPIFHLLSKLFSLSILKLAVLSVSATGHHLPGFIRAYTDKKIFEKFKLRLILVPAAFILTTLVAAYLKLTLIFFVLIVWSVWHGSMQILGFLRIYDVRAKFFSTFTARLDFWMCLTWFIQIVLWSVPKKMSVLSSFYMAGGPLIPIKAAHAIELFWLTLTTGITLAYAILLAYNWIKHRYVNIPKLFCMLFSFGLWAYCIIQVNNLLVGLILWEIFHDLQYNVFVWNYNRQRVTRNLSESRIEQFLFRSDWKSLAIYGLCILLYGCLGLFNQDLFHLYQNQAAYQTLLSQIGNVFAASALIHFYLDGFIWKVRDGKVLRDLGVAGLGGFRTRSEVAHWLIVFLFISLAVGLGYSEHANRNALHSTSRPDNLAELVPKSGYANFMKATRLQSENHLDSAILYMEKAIHYDTNFNFVYSSLAELKFKSGDLIGSAFYYEQAVMQDPDDLTLRESLARLYLDLGRFLEANSQYSILYAKNQTHSEYAYEIGFTYLQMKKGLEAKPYLEKSIQLDSNQPKALNYLGMIEQATGHIEKARELYTKALSLDSGYAHARENLATLKPGH